MSFNKLQSVKQRPVVVAGNGPSLTKIDYMLLPKDFDVFRCNQFYFEDKYFLGKRIKAVFFNPHVFFEQYYTLKKLIEYQEYECEEIYCSKMFWATEDFDEDLLKFKYIYPDVKILHDFVAHYPNIEAILKYHDLYQQERVTSGVLMILLAAIQGYQEIYITGIDFYENSDYAFDFKQKNIEKLINYSHNGVKYDFHNKNIDLKIIKIIEENFQIKIYYLSPDSPISFYLHTPPPNKNYFILKEKNEERIKDILIPEIANPLKKEQKKSDACLMQENKNLLIRIKDKIRKKINLFKNN